MRFVAVEVAKFAVYDMKGSQESLMLLVLHVVNVH